MTGAFNNLFALGVRKARSVRSRLLYRVRRTRSRAAVSRFLALRRPRAEVSSYLHEERSLRENGFLITNGLWSTDDLTSVKRALADRECFDSWNPALGTFRVRDAPAESNNVRIVDVESIPEAIRIANDPKILQIVGRYIGCKPTIDDINAWWSLPNRAAPREEQFFHRDNDSIRFLKMFIYLTDVEEDSGPHVFIPGSHLTDEFSELGGRRFEDEELARAGLLDCAKHFVGPFGMTFLEDTSGLHKGQLPIDKPRLILQIRYTMVPSVFARSKKRQVDISGYDPYTNRVLAGH